MKSMTIDSKMLQQAIVDLGGSVGSAGIDGKWGNASRAGLKQISLKYGVYYSASTRAGSKVKVTPDSCPVLVIGLSEIKKGKDVSAASQKVAGMVYTQVLQVLLNKLGYLPSEINGKNQIDGKFGPNTNNALKNASAKLNGFYKKATSFAKLAGTTITPAATYLRLWQQVLAGAKPAVTAPAPTPTPVKKEAAPVKAPAPAPVTSDPDTWPPLSKAPGSIKNPKKTGKAYVSKDVQYLLYSIQKEEGIPKSTRIAVDSKWGKKSSSVLKGIASKYKRKLKSVAYFNKTKSVIIDPADLVSSLFNALVTLRQGGAPSQPTEVPPPAPAKPAEVAKPSGKPGRAYVSEEVQRLLIALGSSIKDDNIWGPKSRTALKAMAKKYGFKYLSSTGFGTKSSQVLVNPADLVEKLQGKLEAIRAEQAKQAAIKAAREALEKKKAEEAAAAKKKEEELKAAEKTRIALAEKQKAAEAAKQAQLAAQRSRQAAQKKAAEAAAKKKAEAAKKAATAAKAAALKAQQQKAKAAAAAKAAAQAAQAKQAAAAKAVVSKAQATEVIIRQQAAPVYAPAPVYQPTPGYTSQAPITIPVTEEEEEEEVTLPSVPMKAEITPSIPETPSAPTPAIANAIIFAATGLAALGIVVMSRKPKGPIGPPKKRKAISGLSGSEKDHIAALKELYKRSEDPEEEMRFEQIAGAIKSELRWIDGRKIINTSLDPKHYLAYFTWKDKYGHRYSDRA